MGYEYDPSKPTEYLQYLDANNLYSWAMSQPLPTREFKWIDVRENKMKPKKMAETLAKNSNWGYGYLLEVDVEYP